MSNVNIVQQKILELEGGAFQKMFDAYLMKKYNFGNIQTLGVQTGTNKPTKGTPDSYVFEDGKYILINYGTVKENAAKKIRDDIQSCFDKAKINIESDKIAKIICGHTSTNLHVEQFEEIRTMLGDVEVELIGIDTMSYDIVYRFPSIAKDYLNFAIGTHQIFDVDDFVKISDKSNINAPLDFTFHFRAKELDEIINSIEQNIITIVLGPSGIGKTRIVLEACREYAKQGWKVLCIKSNGNLLYNDLMYNMDQKGNYLLFFDDANMVSGVEGVLDYVFSFPEDYNVRVIFTVRDYAKERIIRSSTKKGRPEFIKIAPFKDNEIRDILKENLKIINETYLKKIVRVSSGNIRLAILAGMKSLKDGFAAIKNSEDIFKYYYTDIFNNAALTKEELLFLFIIEATGPVRENVNDFFKVLYNKYLEGVDKEELVRKLYELELIDWFKSEVITITDQSLGNFISYYVIYEKKWIKLSEIISLGFPKFRSKLIYLLSTMNALFGSAEMSSFVKQQVLRAWDDANGANEESYVESFYSINPIRALKYLKAFVESSPSLEFNITDEEIKKNKNYNNIRTKQISIISGFKGTDYFDEACDLLLMYYEKRPDLFMDFFFAITSNLLYDRNSYYYDYIDEKNFLSKLWKRCERGNNYAFSRLYLHVAEYALDTEFTFMEVGRTPRTGNFCRMTLVLSENMKSIRSLIWGSLFDLRESEPYSHKVNEVLTKIYVRGLGEEETKEFIQFDFDQIYPQIEKDINYVNAKIINTYKETAESCNMHVDDRMLRAKENECYRVFMLLARECRMHITGKVNDEYYHKSIENEINDYTINDFDKLFSICEDLCKIEKQDVWGVSSGIATIFKLLETDKDRYLQVVQTFFEHKISIMVFHSYEMVDYMLKSFGYTVTRNLIDKGTAEIRNNWLYSLWDCIPKEQVTTEMAAEVKQLLTGNTVILRLETLLNYCKVDKTILECVSQKLITNPELVKSFLMGCDRDEIADLLIEMYDGKIEILENLYFLTSGMQLDLEGNLFWKLYQYNPHVWERGIGWLQDNYTHHSYDYSFIEKVWQLDEYSALITYGFYKLINSKSFYRDEILFLLFGGSEKDNTVSRKKDWLLSQLRSAENSLDIKEELLKIVIAVFPDWEIEYLLEFIKTDKRIDSFKKLYFFPISESWVGSEIPLINKKIVFLHKLESEIRGLEYVEHKEYLGNMIRWYENNKEEVELREYIENAIYA